MDFAKKHLEKYGWSEGDGLGKTRDGMVTAIKPKLKFDSAGLGHTRTDEFAFHWWDHVYNSAASNIQVTPTEDGTVVIQKGGENVNVTNKKPVKSHRPKSTSYGNFCKAGLLKTNGEIENEEEPVQDLEIVERKDFMVTLTDEEIFKACGGRTAHKGARHGHRCTGKLNRIAEQEAALLKQWQSQEATKVQSMGSGSKKVKKENSSVLPTSQNVQESSVAEESEEQPPKKKKKKQKRQEQSASETVEEPVTLVETSPANTKKKKKKKEKTMYTDEGLE